MSGITEKDIAKANMQQLMRGGMPIISESLEKKAIEAKNDSLKKSLEKANSYLRKMKELERDKLRFNYPSAFKGQRQKKSQKTKGQLKKEMEWEKEREARRLLRENEARKLTEEREQRLIELQKKIREEKEKRKKEEERIKREEEEKRKKEEEERIKKEEEEKRKKEEIIKTAVDDLYKHKDDLENLYSNSVDNYLNNLKKIKKYVGEKKEKYEYYASSFEEAANSSKFEGDNKEKIKEDAQNFREEVNSVINELSTTSEIYKEFGGKFLTKKGKFLKLLNDYNNSVTEKSIINEIYELNKELNEMLPNLNEKLIGDVIDVKDKKVPLIEELKEEVINGKWNIKFININVEINNESISTYLINGDYKEMMERLNTKGWK